MSANLYYDNITKHLLSLADQAAQGNALGLTNTAVHAENLFAEMLELIFGWKLTNANEKNRNQDTFDLNNDKKGLLVQVTTNKKYKGKYDRTLAGLSSTDRPKVKRFVFIFLTKQLPASVPANARHGNISIETFDIKRLSEAIFFKVRSPKKLKALNELLQVSTMPVALLLTDELKTTVVPRQKLVPRRNGIYIRRPAVLENLFNFIQENDGLLVGGPGYGKSFLLQELQERYYAMGLGCVLIRINELTDGTDKEIGDELHTSDRWLEALKNLTVSLPHQALVIFDAYDTAKDEKLKSNILRHIRRSLNELKGHCRVLVSVRTYDATRSRKLQELFPHQATNAAVRCRFFELSELTEPELGSALASAPAIKQIAGHCSPALQRLLRTPYFLKLFEQIVLENGLQTGKLFSGIETEGQLLEVYWRLFVQEQPGSELLADRITRALAEREALVLPFTDIVDQAALPFYENLVSNGVLVTSGSMGTKIGFTHNILLDFGIARYLLDDHPITLTAFLRTREKLPFVFRQSFLYYYTHLYKNHNEIFWQHYYHFATIEEPLFRLLHQTSLNYVLVSFYNDVSELLPVFEGPKNDAQGNRVRKLLEAVRFITKGHIRAKDLSLLQHATSNMHWLYLWETGNLLDRAITIFLETNGIQHSKLISTAAADYLDKVLTDRLTFEHQYLIDRNGGRFAVRNLCRTIAYQVKRGRGLIKRLLELLKEEDFPIAFFHDLSDQLLPVFQADRTAAAMAFKAMYLHQETSDKQTTMGSSVVMSFLSNRKQDYGLVNFRLDKVYAEMLRYDFIPAMEMGIEVVNQMNDFRRSSWSQARETYDLKIGTIVTKLDENRDFFEHIGDRGPEGVLEKIFKILEEQQKATDGAPVFENGLKAMFEAARSSNIWRRLMKLLTAAPADQPGIIYDLLLNKAFYVSDETRYEAGELLKAAWPCLDQGQRGAIETVVLDLEKVKVLKERGIAELRISMMLGCVPEGDWCLERSRKFMAEHKPQDNYRVMSGPIAASIYHPSREEKMQRSGFNPQKDVQAARYDQVAEIEQFNNRYRNDREEIKPEAYRPIMPKVIKLHTDAATWTGDARRNAELEVAQFASQVSSADGLTEDEEAFFSQVCLAFLKDERYDTPEYEVGELKRNGSSYSPNARTASIHTCSNMMIGTKGAQLYLDALESQLYDNSETVRFLASKSVRGFWHYDQGRFWRVTTDRIANETNGMAFNELLNNLFYSNIVRSDVEKTKVCVEVAISRLQGLDNDTGRELWSNIAVILINFILRHEVAFAREVIRRHLGLDSLAHSLVFQITNVIDPHSVAIDYENEGKVYDELFSVLAEMVEYRFAEIGMKELSDPRVAADLTVIDHLVEHLNIISTSGKAGVRDAELTPPVRAAFYLKIKPLLDLIVARSTSIASGFMVAHTGYNFMQLLNFMIDEDPEHILDLSNKIVQYAAKNGFTYDNSTLGEIVKLTDALIADHKQILYKTENFNQLIVILDLFANSGWQDALELTWQLKDAF